MSRTLQFKRYANTSLSTITGGDGEIIVDETNHALTVHDGVTAGGYRAATESYVNTNIATVMGVIANTDIGLVNELAANVATLNANVASVGMALANTNSNVSTLQVNVNSSIANTNANIASVVVSVGQNASNIAFVAGNVAINTANIATLMGNVVFINTSVGLLNGNVAVNSANIASVVLAVANTNANVAIHTANISTLFSNVSTLQSNVTVNSSNIATLMGNVSTLQSNVSTLQSNVVSINVAAGLLAGNVSVLQSNVSTLQTSTANVASVFGPYTTSTALQTAKPAASYSGMTAYVGTTVPYAEYVSNGVAWKPVATYATDPLTGGVTGLVNTAGVAISQLSAASQLKKWRVALAKMQGKVQNAKIAVVGDSTDTGYNTSTANSWTGGRAFATDVCLGRLLNGMGISSNIGSAFGNAAATNFATWLLYDTRFTATNMQIHNLATGTAGGGALSPAAAGAWTLNFTPTDTSGAALTYDTVEVYYLQNSTYTAFIVSLDGVGAVSSLSSGSGALNKVTVVGTLAAHVVNISGTAAAANDGNIIGVSCYNSAAKQVLVQNYSYAGASASGTGVSSWTQNTQYYSCINWLTYASPDLSIINLGLNDMIGSASAATYAAALQTLITACQSSGSVILMVPNPSTTADIAPYLPSIYALAASNNVVLIDMYSRWGTYTLAQTDGFMGTDPIHPNKTGFQDRGNAQYQFVLPRY